MGVTDNIQKWHQRIPTTEYQTLVFSVAFTWGILDTVSTYIALLSYGGVGGEANPIVRELMSIHPILLLLAKSLAVGTATGIALWGQPYITTVSGWRLFFYIQLAGGIVTTGMNLTAAYLYII